MKFSLPLQFLGADLLHVYNKQQILHRLNTSGLYIANTKPGGFVLEISNLQSATMVVTGIRVMLRSHSLEKTPSFVEVFGRTHNVNMASAATRWIDVPFTRDESIQAEKRFKITCELVVRICWPSALGPQSGGALIWSPLEANQVSL